METTTAEAAYRAGAERFYLHRNPELAVRELVEVRSLPYSPGAKIYGTQLLVGRPGHDSEVIRMDAIVSLAE